MIERCIAPSLNKNRLFLRILRAAILSLLISIKVMLRLSQGDIVLVVTNPAPLLFIMAIICRIRGVKLFILVHDVFPENLVAAGLLKAKSFLVYILRVISKWVYNQAYRIVVIGRDMDKLIKGKLNADIERVVVIPNWADSDEIKPIHREKSFLGDLGLKEKFVVQFAGNIGRVQGIENLVSAARLLQSKDIHFLFVGNGADKQLIEDAIVDGKINNITLLGYLPRSEQNNFLGACDISLVSLAPGMWGLGVPSKAYNIMAAGKPIIAVVDSSSEMGLLIEEEGIGWVVPPADPSSLAKVILNASANQELLQDMGRRARFIAENKYSYQNIIDRYRKLFQETCSTGFGNDKKCALF